MKKLHLASILALITGISLLVSSCSVSKEANQMRKNVNGNWYLETIVTEGITGKFKAKIFNETDFSCFIGSAWNFSNNNSTGTYTIVDIQKDCPSVKRNIRWTIYEPKDSAKQFQFKRLDENKKEMDNGDGFRFTISKLDSKEMKLRSEISFEGRPAAVIYNFVRN